MKIIFLRAPLQVIKGNSMFVKKWAFIITVTAHYLGMACSYDPSFSNQVHTAYEEFKKKDRTNRYCRYLCYGLISTGFALTVFRNAFPSLSRIQEQWILNKVKELSQKQTGSSPENHLPYRTTPATSVRTSGFFKQLFYSITSVIASFIQDRLFVVLAYGLISPILDPIQQFMTSERTVLARDVWFLHEQVRESHAPFVLVSMDLSNFVEELKAWELEVRHSVLSLTTMQPFIAASHESARQQVCYRIARIIGHIKYMCEKASDFEHLTMKVLYNTLYHQTKSLADQWLKTCNNDNNITTIQEATVTFEKSIKFTLLPLLAVTLYRIHPWPAFVACSDYARECVTKVVTNYGNPLL
jgi:hypothetical protein